ncbi:MAG TPA: glycosyl hydrolase [Solirubrobacteraceae bacterium]|nr:glycosyl hydrolase [Solirubrobacteraceae bacterium]
MLWGASFGNPAPWNWSPIRSFDHTMGKSVSVVSFGLPFEHCGRRGCGHYRFPAYLMTKIRSHGAIPVINWSSMSIPWKVVEPRFTLRAIIRGRFDGYIKSFARAARRWGKPFFLRFDWEMNGNWFPWGVGINGNHASEFVAAWRHVHHLFSEVHSHNARWLWCPNVGHWASLYSVYPGSGYVDWTCLDGYNWGTTGGGSPGALRGGFRQFSTIYSAAYHTVVNHIAPRKPMMLGEVASNDHGGNEAAWITEMFRELPTQYPDIRGLMWYQVSDRWDFPLRRHTAAAQAFSTAIKSRRYAGNVYCKVTGLAEAQIDRPPAARCKN